MLDPPPTLSQPLDCAALFDAHASFVWRALKRQGVPERELPDACQEVFLVVHRQSASFEGRSSIRTWLYGIAMRVALGMRRKAHVRREVLTEDLPEQQHGATPLAAAEQRQQLWLIESALASLPDVKREVFALYELEGMTMAEVAGALGVAENTALSRLYAAREHVRAFVARRNVTRSLQPVRAVP